MRNCGYSDRGDEDIFVPRHLTQKHRESRPARPLQAPPEPGIVWESTDSGETKHPFPTILVAYDGSPGAQRATEIAFSMVDVLQSRLLIFSVIQLPEPAIRAELNAILDDSRDRYEQSFAQLRHQARQHGVEIETEIEVGRPAEHIVHRAEQAHAELIIMGRCEISAFRRWIFGSTSERVLHYAHCPVMVVH